jgi:hypothetical protein
MVRKLAHMQAAFRCVWLWLAVLATASSGCGGGRQIPDRVSVSGQVLVDGKPLKQGTVQFVPDGPGGHSAVGTISDGRFTMKSTPSHPGVVRASYRVSIVSFNPVTANGSGDAVWQPIDRPIPGSFNVPERYMSTEESGLSVDVDAPIRDLTFDLKAE